MKIGILGGGQLAQMLAQAGKPLGMEFMFLCPNEQACAAPLGRHLRRPFHDQAALEQLSRWADVATFEFENVPAQVMETLAEHTRVHPPANALATAQDRLREKRVFDELDIPTPAYTASSTWSSSRHNGNESPSTNSAPLFNISNRSQSSRTLV